MYGTQCKINYSNQQQTSKQKLNEAIHVAFEPLSRLNTLKNSITINDSAANFTDDSLTQAMDEIKSIYDELKKTSDTDTLQIQNLTKRYDTLMSKENVTKNIELGKGLLEEDEREKQCATM